MVEYPTSLPMPDYGSYSGVSDHGLIRTSVPVAAPSQIEGFNSPTTKITMTFSMDNDTYVVWLAWVTDNGWNWFKMPVVSPLNPVLITSTHSVRFISEVSYQKRGDNWLSVSVTAEMIPGEAEDPLAPTGREYNFIIAGGPGSAVLMAEELWTPAEVDTTLWLDSADASTITEVGGLVEQWRDKSGNAIHANESDELKKPQWTDVASGLNFDGSNDQMLLASQPITGTTPRTIFGMLEVDTTASQEGWFSASDNTTTLGSLWDVTHEPDGIWVRVSGNDRFGSAPVAQPYQMSAEWDTGLSNTTEVYVNGTDSPRVTGNSQTINTSVGNSYLGYLVGQSNSHFDGKLYEVIIFDEAVSVELRQIVEGYLAWKWNNEAQLPLGHPYKDAAPTVDTPPPPSGDTIVAGTPADPSTPFIEANIYNYEVI